MEDLADESLVAGAAGGHVADLADHRVVRADLEGEAGARDEAGTHDEPETRDELTPPPFEVSRVDHPLGVVLSLVGELDLATVPVLQEQLDRAARDGAALVIDLSGLGFIDSAGLHLLARTERRLRASGGRLVLVRGPRAVDRVFDLTGLAGHFEWWDPESADPLTSIGCRMATRPIPDPAADRQTAAELDGDLGGVT